MFSAATHGEGGKPPSEVDSWVHVDSPTAPGTPAAGLHGKRKMGKTVPKEQDLSTHLSALQVETGESTCMEETACDDEGEETPRAVNRVSLPSSPHREEQDEEEKGYTTVKNYM
jgi:hypothetical protein